MKSKSESTRQLSLGFLGAAIFTALFHGAPAIAQNVKEFIVRLQNSSPGIQQVGHSNISGTAIVGGFKMATGAGNGKVLTSDASGAASWQSVGSFLLPFVGTGSAPVNQNLFSVTNTGAGDAIYGLANGTNAQGVKGSNNATSGFAYGVWGTTQSPGGSGVRGTNLATSGGSGVIGQGDTASGIGVSGSGYIGGNFETSHTNGAGVQGAASALSGVTRGVIGVTASVSAGACGVHGIAGNTSGEAYGVVGQAMSSVGVGVHGTSPYVGVRGTGFTGVEGFGSSIGLYGDGDNYGVIGAGAVYGVDGGSDTGVGAHGQSVSGIGVQGISSTNTGVLGRIEAGGFGVKGEASSASAYAVHGSNTATTGGAFAGYFTSSGTDARGVYGLATSSTGLTYGTLGQSNSASGGYGVWGLANASTGWSVWAQGRLGASGTKSFCIDHPLDPENKYLLHYSSESPTPQNFYSGNVTTDASGKAWVTLPDYFAEVNTNFKYQLTVVDDNESNTFVQAKVGRKIQGNTFLVMTSAPQVEVSWRIEADRNDLWVRKHGAPDVQEKNEYTRGTYLEPELYGLPKERGTFYARLKSRSNKH